MGFWTSFRRRAWPASVAVALAVAPMSAPAAGPASSSPPPPAAKEAPGGDDPVLHKAMDAYERGTELYGQGKYEEALEQFLDAQRLYASPYHHHNIARCYEALGKYELAIEYYKAYLRADPDDGKAVLDKIEQIELLIDARDRQSEPAAQPAPEPAPPVDAAPPDDGDEDRPETRRGIGLIAAGAAVTAVGVGLAVGGGVAFGLRARDRADAVRDVFEGGNPEGRTFDESEALDAEGRRAETLQIVTATIGGVVAAGGVAMLAVGLVRRQEASRTAAVRPSLGPGHAGIVLEGRF